MLLTSLQGTGEGETLHLRLTRSGSTMRVLHTTEMGTTKELPQSPGSEQSLTLETTPKTACALRQSAGPTLPLNKAQGRRSPSSSYQVARGPRAYRRLRGHPRRGDLHPHW